MDHRERRQLIPSIMMRPLRWKLWRTLRRVVKNFHSIACGFGNAGMCVNEFRIDKSSMMHEIFAWLSQTAAARAMQPLDISRISSLQRRFRGVGEKAVQRGDHRAPSPIAPPTRLTEPERTSPTANTPGTLDSSGAPASPSAARPARRSARSRARRPPRRSPRASRSPDRRRRTGTRLRIAALSLRRRSRRSRQRHAPPGRPVARRAAAITSVCGMQLDVGRGLDAIDQVARHAGGQARRRAPACAPGGVLRQEHRRLAGRVAAADQHHLLPARTCCASSADAQYQTPRPSNSLEPRHVGPAVARAAGDHHGARAQPAGRRSASSAKLAVGLRACSRATAPAAGISISAPNFCACTKARPASAWPEMPVGKPR